ncbi:MAG: class I SAM-dependent methyltransferase [Anaerolineales bacterium]
MDAVIAQRLVDLNRQFYQSLAAPFSASRGRLQPGVLRVLEEVPAQAEILDLGCGNGGVAAELQRRGHRGRYVGLDSSEELMEAAKSKVQRSTSDINRSGNMEAHWVQADLISPDWHLQSPISSLRFDYVLAFAVLHHIPSRALRLQFLTQMRGLLATAKTGGSESRPYTGGRFVLSNWQFLNSPRLRTRIQPWETVGLSATVMDEGDFLLDWRSGGSGLRYVHHFSEGEMAELAQKAGFQQVDSFFSDGKLGNLALYQTWLAS